MSRLRPLRRLKGEVVEDLVNSGGPYALCCGKRIVFRRTPLLPAPSGIWQHEEEHDDHELELPWEFLRAWG